jgi:hypothetical protein
MIVYYMHHLLKPQTSVLSTRVIGRSTFNDREFG